jgi:uncharacterized membrane protein YebE (DUF533 family)
LRRLLDAALADGCSSTEQEQVAIDKAVKAEDRAAALQRLLDAELAKPMPSSRKATELAGEIRQLEATVVKLTTMLAPDPDASAPPKSAQHVTAARTRWDRRSHRSA